MLLLVKIGLTNLPKSGGALAPPSPPGTTGLKKKNSSRSSNRQSGPLGQIVEKMEPIW